MTRRTYCSCGDYSDHVIARRQTLDGISVLFWNDGSITGAMGYGFFGYEPRNPGNIATFVDASWLLADEIELYEASEVKRAVQVARRAIQQTTLNPRDYFRRVMAGAKFQAIKCGVKERDHA